MVMSPYEFKIIDWDDKPQTNRQKNPKIKSIRIKYLTKENLRPNQTLIKDTPKVFSLIFNNFEAISREKNICI